MIVLNPAAPGAVLRSGDKAIVRLANSQGEFASGVTPNLTRSLVLIEQEDPYSTTKRDPSGIPKCI